MSKNRDSLSVNLFMIIVNLLLIALIIKGKENVIFLDTLYSEWHDKYFTSIECPVEIWAANGEYFA